MTDALEQLVDSLLWEGYALYPYTPTATKNATPTPFGIVYPPVYAATLTSTYDHLELRCVLEAPPDAVLGAEVRFLAPGGQRHQAVQRRIELPGAMVGALAHAPARKQASMADGGEGLPLELEVTLEACELGESEYEVTLRVANGTLVSSGLDRAGALGRSLLSTHPIVRVQGGRFLSPLERPCQSINTFPVLASPADDVVLGAAIVLPDHPEIAPESRGGLFDSTEIEEALLLHVQALSDAERKEIENQDPAVREMIARAAAATPEEIIALHGRVTVRDPHTTEPPTEPPGLVDPRAGEEAAEVDGVTFRRGAGVIIRPGPDADLHARMLDGRSATIERIFTDYDGRTHLGVTIDDDPGQELMRETGRYLFFFAEEVEVMDR
ncbi:MAG TPA: hypothetical protein VFI54_23995 [Solirubrobacteraceae bacterium]|nr:hypothetical protein [Solirubrobacteraceae bacterium]